jgi:LAS superfamily LD-carboxypeptidase LdcB
MKKLKELGIVIGIILLLGVGSFLSATGIKQLFTYLKEKNQNKITYVSGNKHIYKGQKLDPKWEYKLESLDPRESWLKSSQLVDIRIKPILKALIENAEKDGMCLVVTSGYRSPEEQNKLYLKAEDKTFVAKSDESEHQTGLAVDFAACPMKNGVRDDNTERLELKNDFIDLPEYAWLVRNAYSYGLEQSFTNYNTDITGYKAEPWHWKYIIKK